MNKIRLTLEDLFEIPTAEIFNPDKFKSVTAVSIDSRNISRNSIFIAIKGDKLDGHKFIQDAVNNGAEVIIINKSYLNKYKDSGLPFITVGNTTTALGDIAKKWREKLSTKIICITGSTGKTSTKEMIAVLLNEKYSVNKTIANNNNHIGVPLTILSTNNSHEILVAELGSNHFGEIEYTSRIAQPDYSLITNIGDSHLEFLKNRRGVLNEKLALFEASALRNGTLFINNNDTLLKKVLRSYPNKVTYGFDQNSDVQGEITGYSEDGRANIRLKYGKKILTAAFPLHGEQSAKNFLASAAVAFKLGLSKEEIIRGLGKLTATDKRLNIKRRSPFFLIDDTYNANPDSMKAAIELLGKITIYKRKIAVIGDMFELGEEAVKKHKALANTIKKNNIDELYTIGKFSKHLHDIISKTKIKTRHFSNRESMLKFINSNNFTGSVILVKGSRGMKMEEFVEAIEHYGGN